MLRSLLTLVRGWRAALLLVVVACASPSRASAECGSHVIILNSSAVGEQQHAMPTPDEMPAAPQLPCSGPNCSRTPDHPTPSPFAPVVTPDSGGKEAAHTLGMVEPPAGSPSYPESSLSSRPISRASSVFHPPRIG
jgi:hypothetical protein